MATVIGVFGSRDQAESAIRELRDKGFSQDEISLVAKDGKDAQGGGGRAGGAGMAGEGSVVEGTVTGGAIGGAAGLLAGIGALAIPGIGPIVAAGPLAAALSGAVTGGLVGGLVDLGIPDERGQFYEEKVRQGRILTVVKTDARKGDEAARVLRAHGASDVEMH